MNVSVFLAMLTTAPPPQPSIPVEVGGVAGLLAGASALVALVGYCLRELNKFRDSQYAAEAARRKEAEKERDEEKVRRRQVEEQRDETIAEMQADIAGLHREMAESREQRAADQQVAVEVLRQRDVQHAEQVRRIEAEQRARREAQETRHERARADWQAREVRLVGETHRLRLALAATTEGIPPDLDPERPDVPMQMPDPEYPTERSKPHD